MSILIKLSKKKAGGNGRQGVCGGDLVERQIQLQIPIIIEFKQFFSFSFVNGEQDTSKYRNWRDCKPIAVALKIRLQAYIASHTTILIGLLIPP